MSTKIVCDNCGKECYPNYIQIREHTIITCPHIEPCNYDVCCFDCGIAVFEKQKYQWSI